MLNAQRQVNNYGTKAACGTRDNSSEMTGERGARKFEADVTLRRRRMEQHQCAPRVQRLCAHGCHRWLEHVTMTETGKGAV